MSHPSITLSWSGHSVALCLLLSARLASAQEITINGQPAPAGTKIAITLPDPAPTPDPEPPAPPEPPKVESPTGRNPRLAWSAAQQAVWQRMQAEKHPWMVWLISQADAPRVYPDNGAYQVLAYQITGKVEYARRAWEKIKGPVATPANANQVREYFAEYVIWYDWLYPALSEEERKQYVDGLNGWARYCLGEGQPVYVGGFRTGDSDQTVGQYFGLALLDAVSGSDWLSKGSVAGHLPKTPIGGLEPTGVNRDTVRNTLAWYAKLAEGGEWIESSEYNLGTTRIIALGVAAMKTAHGKDFFPELSKFLEESARANVYRVSSDLKAWYTWGDTEAAGVRPYDRMTTLCMLSGLTKDPYCQQLILDFWGQYPDTAYPNARPWWRAFYFFDPYAPVKDWRELPPVHFSPGQGIITYKTADTLFVAHAPPAERVDHSVPWTSDFVLYRNGKWKVSHAATYGARQEANTLLLYGMASMLDRGIVGHQITANGVILTAATQGPLYNEGYYNPPPAYVTKAVRSIEYQHPGKIIVRDDVVQQNPTTLPRFDRYTVPHQAILSNSTAYESRLYSVEGKVTRNDTTTVIETE